MILIDIDICIDIVSLQHEHAQVWLWIVDIDIDDVDLARVLQRVELPQEATLAVWSVPPPPGTASTTSPAAPWWWSAAQTVRWWDSPVQPLNLSYTANVPDDFEAVVGDPNKSCKESRGGQEVQCLCSRDLCNDNYMAQPPPNLSTSLTSTGALACLATLLVTLNIWLHLTLITLWFCTDMIYDIMIYIWYISPHYKYIFYFIIGICIYGSIYIYGSYTVIASPTRRLLIRQ